MSRLLCVVTADCVSCERSLVTADCAELPGFARKITGEMAKPEKAIPRWQGRG